ncbi:MAG: DUF927 domain-containing protein [Acholeplasmatales bacterium]|nr:DUF927 domain-containing protein [Acholeplasmatales bacterium]
MLYNLHGNVSYLTNKLGWQQHLNWTTPQFILESANVSGDLIKYEGIPLKFTKGDFKSQLKFLKTEVLPHKECQFALSIGLSSIISSYIEPYKHIGTLVTNVSGKSSTGKSTIAELSASLYGCPETSNTGLVRTFNATKTSILAISEGRNGLPIILDDANANPNEHNKSDLIYEFALGEARARCNSDGTVQEGHNSWSGIVIITSESPLMEAENFSQGAHARCLTINDVKWTQSAAHSERIKTGVNQNYGFVGKWFADKFSAISIESILNEHSSISTEIYDRIKIKDHMSKRMADKMAPIVMAAKYFNAFLKHEVIDVESIIEFLINANDESTQKRSLAENTFDLLIQYIIQNQNHFHIKYPQMDVTAKSKVYGKIELTVNKKYCYILKSQFDSFLKENGITEKQTILKQWKNEGKITSNEADRNTQKISGLEGRCLAIPIDSFDPELFGIHIDEPIRSKLLGLDEEENEKQNVEILETPKCAENYEVPDEVIDELFKE